MDTIVEFLAKVFAALVALIPIAGLSLYFYRHLRRHDRGLRQLHHDLKRLRPPIPIRPSEIARLTEKAMQETMDQIHQFLAATHNDDPLHPDSIEDHHALTALLRTQAQILDRLADHVDPLLDEPDRGKPVQ